MPSRKKFTAGASAEVAATLALWQIDVPGDGALAAEVSRRLASSIEDVGLYLRVEAKRQGVKQTAADDALMVHRQLTAAEVALEDGLPGIALQFLAGLDKNGADVITTLPKATRDEFLRVLQAARAAMPAMVAARA